MNAGTRRHLSWQKLAIYCSVFFAVWTLRAIWLIPWLASTFEPVLKEWVQAGIKLLVWTAPAVVIIRRYPDDMQVPKLFAAPLRWPYVLGSICALFTVTLVGALISGGGLRVHPAFDARELIGAVLFVGITEEMVFRGLLLNRLATSMKPVHALLLSSLLFLFIHYPSWIQEGLFANPLDVLGRSVSVFVLGVLFGLSFLREKNLLPPMLLHMVWNLGVLLFQGG